MQIKRYYLLTVLFLILHQYLPAQNILPASEYNKPVFYAGINPLALLAFLPNGIGTFGTVFGVVSNQEFGISFYGGMNFAKAHSLEARFSTGPASTVIWDTQLQFGYVWYPLEQFFKWNGGLTSGIMLRQFFWNNRITDNTNFNLTPELLLGWRFIVKSLAFDVRAGWNFSSITWSTIPNTKTAARWTPFPYNVTLTTGIAWIFY